MRLIDGDALLEELRHWRSEIPLEEGDLDSRDKQEFDTVDEFIAMVDDAPTVEYVTRYKRDGLDLAVAEDREYLRWACEMCGYSIRVTSNEPPKGLNWCIHCGRKVIWDD